MAPCAPALQFVANGQAGSAFPAPLDPSTAPLSDQEPTFSQIACETLADQCQAIDPISAIDDLEALADANDALAAASDDLLTSVLLELDQIDGQQQVQNASDVFTSDQGGITDLLGGADASLLPAVGTIPLLLPSGAAGVVFGGDPAYGGAAAAGGPAYNLHLSLPGVGAGNIDTLRFQELDGPNPPFTGGVGVELDTSQAGVTNVAIVAIDPAVSGTFTATLKYTVVVTITGITGLYHGQKVFQVIVQ